MTTPIPENAAAHVIDTFRPDVVVGSSILRLAWRKVRSMCESRQIRTVLYIREVEAFNHFSAGSAPADAVVANAESLTAEIRRRGFDCTFIPSVIETSVTATVSTREVALVINPIASRGVDIVWQIAERLSHLPFVVQESWSLDDAQVRSVEAHLDRCPNVEFRRAEPPGPRLYGDTRVLLVPYRIDNRPRVIAEAQANGIPVVAGDVPALVEAIGDGGVLVPLEDIDAWCAALELLWSDEAEYRRLAEGAAQHSHRAEIDPVTVAKQFERIVLDLAPTQR